jgi:hypothetical protein
MIPPLSGFAGKGGGSWAATLTVASGEVGSNLSDYPLYVDLADMNGGFWANTNEGKDMRAYVGGSQVPVDVVWCSVAERKGAAFIKVPTLASAADTVITLVGDGFSDRLANNNANGRNAVWTDYESVFLLGETAGDDRTGKAMASTVGDPDYFELIETSSTDLNSHNGIAWDGTHYYTTDNNAIYKWNSSWTLVDSNTDPIGDTGIVSSPTVNHCGDPDIHNGLLYIPLECYPASGGLYNAHIAVFDTATLSFVTSFDISAQAHEASGIAYCPRDGLLYITDYDADSDTLFKYNPSTGAYVGDLTMDHSIPQAQGIVWWRDHFWISQDANDETIRVSYSGEVSTGNLASGAGGIGFGTGTAGFYEGITARDNGLVQLIDPGATERAEVWRPLRLAKAAQGGITSPGGVTNSSAQANGRASYQTYTLGCTLNLSAKTQNHVAVSYIDESAASGTNRRQVIGYRHSATTLALWDVNNSWLQCSPIVNPTVGTSYRVHARYQGSTSRQIFVDGTQRNTAGPITAVPADLDKIIIGLEDDDLLETFTGSVGFVYLRPSVLSADWIAAEYSNLNAPSSFYSIT